MLQEKRGWRNGGGSKVDKTYWSVNNIGFGKKVDASWGGGGGKKGVTLLYG